MSTHATRRSFVKLSLAGLAGLSSAGYLAAADIPNARASESDEEERTVDALVVGGGIAGLVAAISCKLEGIEDVILIEKLGVIGGCALGSMGGIVVDSAYTPDGVDDSLERILDLHAELQSYSVRDSIYPDQDKVSFWFSETGKTYDMLRDNGVDVPEIADNGTRAFYNYASYNGAPAFIESLVDKATELGVDIVTECAAQELVMEDGAVVGLVAECGGSAVRYNAGQVILATGGFGSNPDMVAEYIPEIAEAGLINRGTVGATGEGIKMALAAGGVGFEDYWATISAGSITFSDAILEACEGIAALNLTRATKQNVIVDSTGKRFTNEDVPDQSVIANYMVVNGVAPYYLLYSNPDAELGELFDKGVEAGVIFKADTVEELERAMGITDGALVETVEAYNGYCTDGNDPDFGKNAENLVAYDQAPYYALEFYTKMIGTMGGVQTNTDTQVVDADGNAIPGLLAIGEVSNRDLYNQVYLGGACIGIYSTMGRVAGVTAAREIGA